MGFLCKLAAACSCIIYELWWFSKYSICYFSEDRNQTEKMVTHRITSFLKVTHFPSSFQYLLRSPCFFRNNYQDYSKVTKFKYPSTHICAAVCLCVKQLVNPSDLLINSTLPQHWSLFHFSQNHSVTAPAYFPPLPSNLLWSVIPAKMDDLLRSPVNSALSLL